ncbi:hypothetical protein B0H11DRAFT_486899 [Mycena galericulata]|nr:hypothetical protein B0H11DRAFT_486899 [Mycena galericulata]
MQDLTQLRARARAMQAKKGKGKERATEAEAPARAHTPKEKPRVVGERVYFPGSPAPVTTAQLLAEAEAEVSVSLSAPVSFPSASASVGGASVSTRLPALRVSRRSDSKEDEAEEEEEQAEGPAKLEQAWGKADWKALDACFTDERIAVAARCGLVPNLPGGEFSKTGSVFSAPRDPFSTPVRGDAGGSAVMMASADAVDLGAVVGRFVQLYGAKWDVDSLTQRARAIQNKQRAGHVAPPTPTAPTPANAGLGGHRRRASMEMPELTPLGKPARRARLPPPVGRGAPFSALPPTPEPARRRRVPGSLLAPRYSHLLEEAVAVGGSGTSGRREEQGEDEDTSFADTSAEAEPTRDQDSSFEDEQQQDTSFASSDGGDAEMAPATPLREREALLERPATSHPPAPATIGKRVKGFLFSYLPTLSKTAPPAPASRAGLPARPRLPLPPLELLEKPRGPIKTPVRPPLPKARAPKELVSLQPAPPPAKKALPTRRAPRRLVDLNHVEPPPEPEPPRGPRPRTSSGGSVKDLVKNFEALDGARAKGAEVKRVRSVGDFGNKRPGAGAGAARPMWRP